MITRNWRLTEYRGLSTDTKPNKASNGAMFVEMDTQKVFFYDAENKRWIAPLEGTEKEPIAYSYNGTVLPPLPEWDKTAYPYVYIISTQNTDAPYQLLVYSKPLDTYSTYGTTSIKINGSFEVMVGWYRTVGEWDELTDPSHPTGGNTLQSTVKLDRLVWSNTDVPAKDGTIYLSASEPIPVYE